MLRLPTVDESLLWKFITEHVQIFPFALLTSNFDSAYEWRQLEKDAVKILIIVPSLSESINEFYDLVICDMYIIYIIYF